MINKFKNMYETRGIYIIGFLLSFPIISIVNGSLAKFKQSADLFFISAVIWTILFLLKPIKKYILVILFMLHGIWSLSIISYMPLEFRAGIGKILVGSSKWADYIVNNFSGKHYVNFLNWTRDFVSSNKMLFDRSNYEILLITIITVIMIVVMYLLEKRTSWVTFVILSLYFVVAWFLYIRDLKGLFSIYFIGITMYRQYLVSHEQIEISKREGGRTRYYNYSSSLLVGSIIMIATLLISNVVLMVIPKEEINLSLDPFIPSIGEARTEYKVYKNSKIFTFNSTMYSPNSENLGGPIGERDFTVLMRVEASEGRMYLRGRVKNAYDGSKWTSENVTFNNRIPVDESIDNEHIEEITLRPETLVSRTVFSPYKYVESSYYTRKIYGNVDNVVYKKKEGSVGLENYSVKFIKSEYTKNYDELLPKLRDSYLGLPRSGISQTTELTIDLVKDVDSQYDKMKILEKYLRENYRYTLKANEVNVDNDFVESFLFEDMKGYCTYFATSLAVMGRIADIPTRYVEGFVTSYFADNDGYYEVTANNAHAWVEAYIDGEGWVKFEPTPAYFIETDFEPENYDEEMSYDAAQLLEEGFSEINSNRDFSSEFFEETENVTRAQTEEVVKKNYDLLLYVIAASTAIVIVILIRKRIKYDIENGDYNIKIRNRITYILSMVSIFDKEKDVAEIPTNLIKRTSTMYLDFDVSDSIIKIINANLYSNRISSKDEFENFDEFFKDYEDSVRRKIKPFMYVIRKYLLNTLYHKDYYKD